MRAAESLEWRARSDTPPESSTSFIRLSELGDVSQGKLVTSANFFELFNGILNPKQLEGLRLLVTPFPQQQFNATDDRRSELPSLGVSSAPATP